MRGEDERAQPAAQEGTNWVPKHTKVAIELRRQRDRMEPRDVWAWHDADKPITAGNVRSLE